VLGGNRQRQSDADWDNAHGHDCDAPESVSLNNNPMSPPQSSGDNELEAATDDGRKSLSVAGSDLRKLVSRAAYRVHPRRDPSAAEGSGAISTLGRSSAGAFFQLLDGNTGDATSSSVAAVGPNNAIGSPRFAATEQAKGAAKAKNILGSSDYVFTAPVLSLPGRGIATNLAMVYNSQLWSMDSGGMMFFDLNRSWPAPGWNLGYGRLIVNYNGSKTGDGSGTTSANYPGDYLLIQSDGTRIPIIGRWV